MRKIKTTGVTILTVLILGTGVYVVRLEFITIPNLLARQVNHQSAYIVHLTALFALILGSVAVGAWSAKQTIFRVHEQLINSHLNMLISSIGNLATGYWASDSRVQKGVFTTGAKMGYSLRDEITEPDRAQIVEEISTLSLPVKQAPGQGNEVVNDMTNYLDDLDRKRRLSQ